MKIKKILFVGHSLSSFAKPIVRNLRKLGYDVDFFDHYSPNFLSRGAGFIRNAISPISIQFDKFLSAYTNNELVRKTTSFEPDLVLLFKAKNIEIPTIKTIRRKGFIVANWYPDYYDDWTWIKSHAKSYDYFFTPCEYIRNMLQKEGIKSYYVPFAAEADESFRVNFKKYQVSFVGRYTERRDKLFKDVFDAGVLDIWGYQHWQSSDYKSKYHGPLSAEETKDVIRQSKITINTLTGTEETPILSINLRIFEATGVGGFVLTSYHPPLEEFYRINKEIVCFKTAAEALEKAIFYLKHDSIRSKIARNGWDRTSKDNTYEVRLRQLLKFIH